METKGFLRAAEYTTQASASMCGTATCYLTVDHLGSTRLLTDSTGAVARRYDYLPFGQELLAGTGGRTTAMGYQAAVDGFNPKFTGQMRDAETGLYYLRARYYSPAQGRFTGADPENAGARMGDPQSWNGYAYVGNDPLNYTDPTGEGIFGAVGGIVGRIFGGALGGLIGGLAGNGADAAIWGPKAGSLVGGGFGVGNLTTCGGPLGNCGGIGGGGWDERSPIGPRVQNSGQFIFSASPIPGPPYANQLPEKLSHEIASLRNNRIVPFTGRELVEWARSGGGRIIWVVTSAGRLLAAPVAANVTHAAIAGGESVLAAGEAEVFGAGAAETLVTSISAKSGHYLFGASAAQSQAAVQAGRSAFLLFFNRVISAFPLFYIPVPRQPDRKWGPI